MFHVVPERAHDVSRWRLFVAQEVNWAVLSDEQMSKGWPFSLLNDEQMSNWVGVEHQPVKVSGVLDEVINRYKDPY